MRRAIGFAIATVFVLFHSPSAARATDTCTINGATYTCDDKCSGTSCNSSRTFNDCNAFYPSDNLCVLCIATGGNPAGTSAVVQGTTGADIICLLDGDATAGTGDDDVQAKGGADKVDAGAGDDTIDASGGYDQFIYGGSGNDTIDIGADGGWAFGGPGDDLIIGSSSSFDSLSGDEPNCVAGGESVNDGDDVILGGAGNDSLLGCGGDDTIEGEGGNDSIYGGTGRNVLIGGSGDDYLATSLKASAESLGSVLCGGTGDDELEAAGWGHQCLDAGADQTGGSVDCSYTGPASPRGADVGTETGCANPGSGFFKSGVDCLCP